MEEGAQLDRWGSGGSSRQNLKCKMGLCRFVSAARQVLLMEAAMKKMMKMRMKKRRRNSEAESKQ